MFRGRDAAGVAYVTGAGQDRRVMYVKQKGTAIDLTRAMDDATWAAVARSSLGLLHTRQETQGSKNDNVNNHPVVGYDWVVVHNGIIINDDALFRHFRSTTPPVAERPAAVDSVAINLLLGQGQSVEESLAHVCTLQGSASAAAVHVARPDELLLLRLNGSPVHLYWMPDQATLAWSSDSDGIRAVADSLGGFAGLSAAYELPEKTALHLTPTGLKRYALTPKPYGPSYRVSGGGSYGNSHSGFFTSRRTQGTTRTGSKGVKGVGPIVGAGALAILRDDTGLLEQPLFTGSRQEYHYSNRYDGYVLTGQNFILPTGYGRWILTRASTGAIERTFKPHKRVRRRWEREFADSPGTPSYTVSLPASAEQQEDLSDLLRLANVDLATPEGTSTEALLCPWCGILRHPLGWEASGFKCEWCQVTSLPPKEEISTIPETTLGGDVSETQS